MRRAGPIFATVFAAGLLLGLLASTISLATGSSDLRATMESRLAEQPGPLGNLVLQRLDETSVVDDFAAEARARQIRLVVVVMLLGAALAAALSRSLAEWTLQKPDSTRPARASRTRQTRNRG